MNNCHYTILCFFCFINIYFSLCGQEQYCMEFIVPHYMKISDTCCMYELNDSTTIVSGLFKDIGVQECIFLKKKDRIVLSINGQEGVFFGSGDMGSWILGDESTRFTIKWDSLNCSNYNDRVYEFEFEPYYTELKPFIDENGMEIYFYSNDNTVYVWTVKDGVIAIRGDFILIREDKLSLKECLYK